ncbi:glycosyl transferase [Scytonema sp. NUACC26]|uniref:glycosyl transferase n=1 Tax=Scytonema sp. NUACC26 TaxID=3140176 RepID=UPI0034DB896F
MSKQERVKVFIGSGEASLLERKVSIYSLRKHTKRELDIYVFNGTHNAIELNDSKPFPAPMSLRIKYQNVTEFSLYRYLIPQICDYQGKAIYIDSDTICLTDIGQLFDTPLQDFDFLVKKDAYTNNGADLWGLSVMLIDCEKCKFDLETISEEVAKDLYTYTDFSCMSPAFLAHYPYKIGELNPQWNVFDYYDQSTKLIHYTNLYTQPWKSPNHPYGELWFTYFREAMAAGYITQRDIELSLIRSYVRRDLLKGNSPKSNFKNCIQEAMSLAKQSIRKLRKMQPARSFH